MAPSTPSVWAWPARAEKVYLVEVFARRTACRDGAEAAKSGAVFVRVLVGSRGVDHVGRSDADGVSERRRVC